MSQSTETPGGHGCGCRVLELALLEAAEQELSVLKATCYTPIVSPSLTDVMAARLSRAVVASLCSVVRGAVESLSSEGRGQLKGIEEGVDACNREFERRLQSTEPNPVLLAVWES